eukprot:4240738-Amphidinium_carterae.1
MDFFLIWDIWGVGCDSGLLLHLLSEFVPLAQLNQIPASRMRAWCPALSHWGCQPWSTSGA